MGDYKSKTVKLDWDDQLNVQGQRLSFDFWYPRIEEHINEIEVGLSDVRAADSILISYDFVRDGYVIKQASTFSWEADDEKMDSNWQEVAFIKAWQRESKLPDGKDEPSR